MTLKHQYLMGCLAVLLFLRFVWQPVIEWQQDVVSQIELKQTQLGKIKKLLAQEGEVVAKDKEANAKLRDVKAYIPPVNDVESFKLDVQNEMESLAKENGVRLERYRWLKSVRVNPNIVKETLELRVACPVHALVELQAKWEVKQQLISTDYVNFNFRGKLADKPSWVTGAVRISYFIEVAG